MKGLRRRIRSGQDKKMLEGADICIKSQSPPAAVLYMCNVLHKMKSQSPAAAVQLQRPPVQSPAAAVLYRCNVFLLLLLLCIVQMKSQSPVETVHVYRCKAPPATLAQTKSQSLAAAAAHCTLYTVCTGVQVHRCTGVQVNIVNCTGAKQLLLHLHCVAPNKITSPAEAEQLYRCTSSWYH